AWRSAVPIAISQEQRDLTDAVRDWALRAEPRVTLRENESVPRDNAALTTGLAELGLFGIAVPEELGGADGSLVDLAAGVEQAAAALVPGGALGTALAGLLLSNADNARQTQQLVSELVDGQSRAAVALPDSTAAPEGESAELTATRTAHGDLELRGTIPAVPDADSETHLVLPVLIDGKHQWCLLDP